MLKSILVESVLVLVMFNLFNVRNRSRKMWLCNPRPVMGRGTGDPSLGGATERSKLLELLENPPLHLIGTPSGRMKLLRSHVLCNAEASRFAEDLGLLTARGCSFVPVSSLGSIVGDAGIVDSHVKKHVT